MTVKTDSKGPPPVADTTQRPSIPILMYHQVTPAAPTGFRKYAVTPKAFADQMDWLARAGYVPVGMSALLDHREGRATLPKRPVVLTFDDGYQDCVDFAIPILEARGFIAIFYLVVALIGKTSRWLVAERGIEFPIMSWDAVRGLKASGMECGSHCMNHVRLTQQPSAACRADLLDSRHLLEDRLGRDVRHLAYPFGSYDNRVRALAEEAGYSSACSVRVGFSAPDDDLLALHRLPVNGKEGLEAFAHLLNPVRTSESVS